MVESLDKHSQESVEFPYLDHDGLYHLYEPAYCSDRGTCLEDCENSSEKVAVVEKLANCRTVVEKQRPLVVRVDPLDLMTVVGVE